MSEPETLDLADYLRAEHLDAQIVAPGVPMPSVELAAQAMGCEPDRIFKSILFQAKDGSCVMAIASGLSRVDATRLAEIANTSRLRLASPEVVLAVTGYPAGGTPPIGHRERFAVFVDTRVAAQPRGYGGGGRKELLVDVASADIVRLTRAQVVELTTTSLSA